MTNDMILDLYGKVYDFTDEMGDAALEILDAELDKAGAGVYDRFMHLLDLYDECPELPQSVLSKMAVALQAALDECQDRSEPEFDSAGFSLADRFEDTEEDMHHCDDPGCNCSI